MDDVAESPFGQIMRTQARPHHVLDFPVTRPNKPFKVALVILSEDDVEAAQLAAMARLRDEHKLDEVALAIMSQDRIYGVELERQLICRMLRDPKALDQTGFVTPDELRRRTNADQRTVLIRAYNDFYRAHSPISSEPDPEKQLAKLLEVKEAGDLSEYLTSCDFDTLASIVTALVARLQTPASANSSDTSSSS